MGLGCPHAVGVEGEAVRCGVVDEFAKRGINILQIDHTLGNMGLALNGGGDNIHCGYDYAVGRVNCVGAHISEERLPLLERAVTNRTVLVFPENAVLLARIVAASYFE